MLKIAFDPVFAHPLPEGHRFPMIKYELIPEQLLREGMITNGNLFSPGLLDEEIILMTHDAGYWEQLKYGSMPLKDQKRIGFPLTRQLVERERRIGRGTLDGCHFAMKYGVAFNVAGGTHHAGSTWGEGFCMLNDQAIAARYLVKNKLVRSVLIVDLDVHQGNGTAEIFRNDPSVFTFSMHGANNFPSRKQISDLDIPLDDEVADEEYLSILQRVLPELIAKQRPDFIFYLAGVDVLKTDQLGKMAISPDGCRLRDRFVFSQCIRHSVPVQVSMGGGYSPQVRDIVNAHCETFRAALDLYF